MQPATTDSSSTIGSLPRSLVCPFRFPTHGLQMLASYIAQMAPASRITNCASFQAGDELRRQQRIAYRTAQLRTSHGIDVGRASATRSGRKRMPSNRYAS